MNPTPDVIASLSAGLTQRLADGMPLDEAMDAMDTDIGDLDALARDVDERRDAREQLRQAALDALQELGPDEHDPGQPPNAQSNM